jgi:N-acetylmuramoyl-L-alanine amidase
VSSRARLALVALTAATVCLAGCGSGTTGSATAALSSTAATVTSTSAAALPPLVTTTPPTTPTTATPSTSSTTTPGHGQVVVLDPGHNGGNATHTAEINALVPAGRGQSKACNTTGTSTNAGYPEHAFNWDVANRVQAELVADGYKVILTRPNDTGVGPCVNQRAAIGNDAQAAAVVSIHADGSDSAGAHGFHVEYSAPALNASQGPPSISLATRLRASMQAAGFSLANYIGKQGLFGRPDLGGLNLSDRPTVLIECGNMRDAGDAAVLSSAAGRQRIADAITAGIVSYLPG